MTADAVWHQSASFFDPNARPTGTLIALQVDPTSPTPTGLSSASGMVLPDISIKDRLAHFPDDLYDLRESSHLVRLMRAILGDSGGGQLRKRNAVVQFQSTVQGSHFYDLDGFYGAIFNATRNSTEALPLDPVTQTATTNEWDQIANADSSYRQRLFDLASAINLGATYPGLQQAAEAILQTEVELYEVWDLIDHFPGSEHLGRSGANSRSEVIVVPRKDYDRIAAEQGAYEADRQRLEDERSLIRVLDKIKPAGVLLTVDSGGIALHQEAPITNITSDSNFWHISSRVTANPSLVSPDGTNYPLSVTQVAAGVQPGDTHEIPRPPWSVPQQARWSYASELVSARSYAFDSFSEEDPQFHIPEQDQHADGQFHASGIITTSDNAVLVYQDGTQEVFDASRATLDSHSAQSLRYTSAGVMVSAPYSMSRPVVPAEI